MAAPFPLPPEPASLERVRGVVQAGLRYVAARGKLAQIEAQEAGYHLASAAVLAVVGLGALAGAWLLLVPAAVWFVAEQLHRPWAHVAAVLGGLHLVFAVILLLRLRNQVQRMKLFEESLNQFERDRAWIASNETSVK